VKVIQLSVISITVKEEKITNHNFPVGWDVKKSWSGDILLFFGPTQMSEKRERNR